MSRELVNAICRTFRGAEVSDPWDGGHDAYGLVCAGLTRKARAALAPFERDRAPTCG